MVAEQPPEPVVERMPTGAAPADTLDARALRLRLRQQEILAQFGVSALKGTSLIELLNESTRLSAQGLEAEFAKVLEYIPKENRLLMRAGVGWDAGLVGHASVGGDVQSPSGYALHTGKPVISNHLKGEQRFRTPDLLAAHGVRRAINVILQGEGAPYGVLEVDSRSEGEFSEYDIAFLQGIANLLGMAIERQRRESVLKEALTLQTDMQKEINHRVRNSLQLVASVLNLQAKEEPALRQPLHQASARIMAIGRVHERLFSSPQVESIQFVEYLRDICVDLDDLTPNCNVHFVADARAHVPTDQAIMLALIVAELITNAAKHAYRDPADGSVWVQLSRGANDALQISVRDEGDGIRQDAPTGGLGMTLIATLARQARATVRYETGGTGTTATLLVADAVTFA